MKIMDKLKFNKNLLLNARKIAVIRTDRIGDMILTLPLVAKIKEIYPSSEVTVVARRYVEPILYGNQNFTNYSFVDDFDNNISKIFSLFNFDVAFFPRPNYLEALAGYKSNIPLRIGSGYRMYSFFFNHKVWEHRKSSDSHEVELNLNLLSSITNEKYTVNLIKPVINESSMIEVQILLKKYKISMDDKLVIIHPGSGGSSFEWSAENFGITANSIKKLTNNKILITGTQKEFEKCKKVENYCSDSINLCAKLNLSELICLLSLSNLIVSNSTGVLHIAASLDIPVVGLYPNIKYLSQKRWGPYSKKSLTINPPKSKNKKKSNDMSNIKIDEVVKSAMSFLSVSK